MRNLNLNDLYDRFRDPETIKAFAELIKVESESLGDREINIMEVCGGHTHTIMRFGLKQIVPKNIRFIHGPGCPVCIMPKERIDHAYILAMQEGVILCTLGDMIKVPGSRGSLQSARAKGADVRFVYSPLDVLKVAIENRNKTVIFFAIGFETTTPMSVALLRKAEKLGIDNLLFHINHVTVPEVMEELVKNRDKDYKTPNSKNSTDRSESKIDAFIGPSHVSVISGAKIYKNFPEKYSCPTVVSGFEPVDVMESILMLVKQFNKGLSKLEIQYRRSVSYEGNLTAQKMIDRYFIKRELFRWRGLGAVPKSAYRLREEFERFDAEVVFKDILPKEAIEDEKVCICGDILRGLAVPTECKVFGTLCKPSSPLGSCMVSSEGACNAYYNYKDIF
jgi:hydrogenase expression/formation protein HypD